MRRLFIPATPLTCAPWRIALLTGAYQVPEDFERAGFADAVRARGLPIDLEFVAPEFEHLLDRRILPTLSEEIVAPARAEGAQRVWLGGVSLGAFIAVVYAERAYAERIGAERAMGRRNTAPVDGLCLLAPWLGNRSVSNEIVAAGGARSWQPTAGRDDEEQRAWTFIRRWPLRELPVYLGCGSRDRFAHAQRLLADLLPPDACDTVAGGHDWPVWTQLWGGFLDRCTSRALASLR